MSDAKKVLLVDDEKDLLAMLTRFFRRGGYEVTGSLGANSAIEMIHANQFDLVISDIRMPNGSGIDLLNEINKLDERKPPVIMITGYSDSTIEQVKSLGARAILIKPFSPKDLLAAAQKVLQSPDV